MRRTAVHLLVRVVIVADRLFASRERELLSRLEIGLADEGVRVIQALPEGGAAPAPGAQASGVCTATLTFPGGGLPFTTGLRARRLAQRLEDVDSAAEDSPVDIVHVFGGSLWPFGAALAEACGAGLALEVWRAGLIDRIGSVSRELLRDVLFIAPDPEIERALRQRGAPTRSALWGVHAGDPPAAKLAPGRAPTVMLIGAGNDARAMRAALEGVANCVRSHPDMLIFADALAARRADLYSVAMQRGILANLSLIEEIESRRDLLVQGDVLLLCEGNGEQRTIVLEAMAHSMIVLSVEDRFCDYLRDNVTAKLVRPATREAWAAALGSLLDDPAAARRVGESAREFIAKHRRASDHVRSVLEAYSWLRQEQPARSVVP